MAMTFDSPSESALNNANIPKLVKQGLQFEIYFMRYFVQLVTYMLLLIILV
jgi:hypothetical protein